MVNESGPMRWNSGMMDENDSGCVGRQWRQDRQSLPNAIPYHLPTYYKFRVNPIHSTNKYHHFISIIPSRMRQ